MPARLLRAAIDLTAAEGHQVYADPAGHPFCLGWGRPDADTVRRILRGQAEASQRRDESRP